MSILISGLIVDTGLEGTGDFLTVVEMILDVTDYLTCLMSFSGQEDNIAGGSDGGSTVDSLTTVDDSLGTCTGFGIEAFEHVGENGFRLFKAGIIGGEDQHIGALGSRAGHEGALAVVAVATCAAYSDDTGISGNLAYSVEHIDEGIGSVRIVNDGGHTVSRTTLVTSPKLYLDI